MIYRFQTTVQPDWIDYNGHMRDAYYGLVFSLAVDSLQDEVGFDAEYRARTGCTIYLIEDHTFYLSEVHEGASLDIETRVLDVDQKRFHLHLTMKHGNTVSAVCEFMELHVSQKPAPKAAPMPPEIFSRLSAARLSATDAAGLTWRSRRLTL